MSDGIATQGPDVAADAAGGFDPLTAISWDVYLDASLITGLSDGDPVVTWEGADAVGNDATQGTPGLQGIYKTGVVNGEPVVRFSGSGYDIPSFYRTTGWTAFHVIQRPGATNMLPCLASTTGAPHSLFPYSDGKVYAANRANSINVIDAATTFDLWTVSNTSGDVLSLYKNGVLQSTSPSAAAFGGSFAFLGYRGSDGVFATGDMAHISCADTTLATLTREEMEDFLGAKYGITIPRGPTGLAEYKAARDADSPVASWDLEETSGTTAACNETSTYDLTHGNTPALAVDGPIAGSKAVQYVAGSSEFSETAFTPITDYPFTLECFAKRDAGTDAYLLVFVDKTASDRYAMLASNSSRGTEAQTRNTATVFGGTNFPVVSDSAPTTDWVHVAGIYTSSSSMRLVVNGVDFGISASTCIFPPADRISLGSLRRSSPVYSSCTIALPAVYNTALSLSDIQAHFNASGL